MSKQSAALDKRKAKRLGAIVRRHRMEQEIPASKLADETGLSRSYLSYLETGRFAEVGLDKFARIVTFLKISADEVMIEAGYLPRRRDETADTKKVIRERYKLSAPKAEQGVAFLEFLQAHSPDPKPRGRGK
jgi:transcriptional regulator with XRE-family HTH domain